MKIIEGIEQNSPEWLEFRKCKIGASDAPIIMGESPWCSPLQLWERKMGIAPEQPENFSMARGKELEQQARWVFEESIRSEFPPCVIQHDNFPWMIASLDGFSEDNHLAVEIKCPGKSDHELALKGIVPPKYRPQLQHQIEVCGLNRIYYFSYDGKENACIEVYRDQPYIDKMMVELKKFHKCMATCTPPELTEKDYKIRNDDKWFQNALDWQDAHRDLKTAQEREERYRKRLVELSRSQNSKGFGVKVQKIMRQGSVQYCDIPALQGIDLDQYRKPASESWRITVEE